MSNLNRYWMYEIIRLKEDNWGPLEDSDIVRQVRNLNLSSKEKLLERAKRLAKQDGFDSLLARWQSGFRFAFLILLLLAIVLGISSANTALSSSTGHVNIIFALTTLLGLHLITFTLWLFSFLAKGEHTWLSHLWIWLGKKIVKGPDSAIVPQALSQTLINNGSLRWYLGALSHGIWTIIFTVILISLLALLSIKRYTFGWETTLLSPQSFVHLSQNLGYLPSFLGFPTPDTAMIVQSNGLYPSDPNAQSLWSLWLLGNIVVYGLIIRLAAFIVCFTIAKRRPYTLPNITSQQATLNRLEPRIEHLGIDAPASEYLHHYHPSEHSANEHYEHVLIGLELSNESHYFDNIPQNCHFMGLIDSREQRQKVLDQLEQNASKNLYLVCDARLTPDRGIITLILNLNRYAKACQIFILDNLNEPESHRKNQWKEQLIANHFSLTQLHFTVNDFNHLLKTLHS